MKKIIGGFLGLILVIAVNLYFRSFSVNFPQLKERASSIVNERIYKEAEAIVNQKFSGLYPSAKDKLVEAFISEYKKSHKQQIKEQLEGEYCKLKDPYQDAAGQTYLMELDCWHWARYVDNVLKIGHPGDRVIHGRQWDCLLYTSPSPRDS